MEPRLLYSADVAASLALAAGVSTTATPEVRTLTDSGEYASSTTTTTASVLATYANLGLSFEANVGQDGAGVDYTASGSGYGIALSNGNAALTLNDGSGAQTVTLSLAGANASTAQGQDQLATTSNYIVGNDPSQWHTDIANYGSVTYKNVYQGVDVRYYGTQNQLEYDFTVAPGADANAIRLKFDGTTAASVDDNGNLVLTVAGSGQQVTFKAPVSYQVNADGSLQAVASKYEIESDGTIGFALGSYDASRALVIDPVLDYATYFGTTGTQSGMDVATDSAGNVYITGRTTSTSGAFSSVIGPGSSNGDIYVAKLSPDLSQVIWSTRIGGANDEQGNAIAVDASGNVAVTGWTKSNNFPTLNAAQSAISGGQDAVLFKLDTNGNLVFSTYYGGSGATDSGNAVAFDSSGNVYATGEVSNTGLLSVVLTAVFGTSDNAFVNKYSSTGSVVYQQTLGGNANDYGTGIAVGSGGDVYVVGDTQSSNMAVVNGAQTGLQGSSDGFLVHLDASGSTLYSTYVGGSDNDSLTGVAIDGSGKAYVVGETRVRSSVVFTTTAGAYETSYLGNNHDTGFFRVYDTTQSGAASLTYSTYLGGSKVDTPTGITLVNGKAVIVGYAGSTTDFPVTANALQATNPGSAMFLLVLNPVGGGTSDLQYGTFYASTVTTGGVASYGNTVYLIGTTNVTGYATSGAYQTAASGTDAMVVAITVATNTAPVLAGVVQPPAILEDTPGNGFLVSSLLAGEVTDPDSGAQQGIAIVGSNNSNGTWQYSLDNGATWTAVGATSSTSALLLAADSQTRLRFVPAADWNGTVSAGLTIRAWDRTSGTAGSIADASVTGGLTAFSTASFGVNQVVTPVNDPPVLTAGTVSDVTTLEDNSVSLGLGSVQYGPGGGADEASQTLTYTVTVVPSASLGTVTLANGTAVTANTSYSLADLQGMKFQPTANANGSATFSFNVQDNGGTANGGNDTLVQSLQINVTPVNDPPVLLTGTVGNLTVVEGSGATSLGLASVTYGPGGGADEVSQTLSYTVTAVPNGAVGNIVLADGTTVVVAGNSYTLAQLEGMQFAAASVSSGSGTFSFKVQDNGGTANGGNDTLSQSLTVAIVNQAPTLNGLNPMGGILEDQNPNNGTLLSALVSGQVSDPLNASGVAITGASNPNGSWQYSVDGGSTWTAISGVSENHALLLAPDANTRLRFVPNADWNGTASGLTLRAWDQSSGSVGQLADTTVNGGSSAFSTQELAASIVVTAVNDPPVLNGGSVANLTVRAGTTAALGLAGVSFGPGGGADEASQTLTYTVTAVPPATFGTVFLADGTTAVVAGNSYTLAQLQGMEFTPAGSVSSGNGSFSFTVQDNGGTANGGNDTLAESMTITVANQAPVLNGVNALPTILEDPASNNGMLVADLIAGQVSDPRGAHGIAVVSATQANGVWQYSLDNGATWQNFTGVSTTTATLLAADSDDRVRFVPNANWNGSPDGVANGTADGLVFRAWDGSGGTASATTGDTTVNGGSSPYSAATADASVTITPVNDPPVLLTGTVGNLTVVEGSGATSLGLASVTYGPGGGSDEVAQTLSYTVTAVPNSAVGNIVLADGTTVVVAGNSYTLAQIQGMQFAAASVSSGSGTFSFKVQDNGGTANGGNDTLSQSLTVVIVNQAPTLNGLNPMGAILEDQNPNNGTLLSALVSGQVSDPLNASGVAITGASNPNGSWQYSVDGGSTWTAISGVSENHALLLAPDANTRVRFVPNVDWNGTASGLTLRAWDQSSGSAGQLADTTVNGGSSAFSTQELAASIVVTPVNDAPVLAAGAVNNITVLEDSGNTSLGLGSIAYGPGGGADEASQTLTYTVTAVPPASVGRITLANGTVVTTGTYTLAQIQGMQFQTVANANGSATFSFQVQDSGGTANGGKDTLVQSLQINVTPVNDPPALTAGSVSDLTVLEDSGATSLGLGGVTYGPGGGADEAGQTLTYTVTAVPAANLGQVMLADGSTPVVAGMSYSLAQIQGMQFQTAANANGSATFSFQVQDNGGTANGGSDTLAQSLQINVTPVNDPPVRTAGTVGSLSVLEDSGSTSLGLVGLAYGPGGGADEASQTLTYSVTAIPPASLGQITLADGTVVTAGNYTLAQLQGMRFQTAANANGNATFSFQVQDNGGTANGGSDTLVESLQIGVTPVNDPPVLTAGSVSNLTVLEDSGSTSLGLGGVAYGPGGGADEASQTLTYTVTALPPSTLGQITLSDGTAVTAGNYTLAQIQGMQFQTASNANGSGSFTFQVQDNGGTANGGSDTLAQSLQINVTPVNDPPVLTAGSVSNLTVLEDSGSTSLGLGGVAYGPGGGADEASQTLTYTVTALPPSTLGQITLSDGTAVTAGNYTLAQIQGMRFQTSANANGAGVFTFQVQDNGGTANGGNDTLAQSLQINVTPVNDPPVLTAGSVSDLTVLEDSGTTGLGLGGVMYGPGGGADEASQTLTYTVTALPPSTLGQITLSDGTAVTAGNYTLAQIQGMRFQTSANANGAGVFTFQVQDNGGTANGGNDTLAQSLQINVTPVNDPPVLTAGSISDLTVLEDSGTTSLGLGGVAYGPGGGADEASQTLTYTVTALPPSTLGQITLSDGTAVTAGNYTLAQIQGMQFQTASHANGNATFSFNVQDNGGTANGGSDTLVQTLQIRVTPVNYAPTTTAITLPPVLEGSGAMTITSSQLLANASDVDGDPLSVANLAASSGTLVNNGNGTWTFTPAASQSGTVAFTYDVSDGTVAVAGSASLLVNPVPHAQNDTLSASQDTAATYASSQLLANDSDADGDPLTIASVTSGHGGTVVLNADGSITFTPTASFTGAAGFTYTVSDGTGLSASATVTVNVAAVDHAPAITGGSANPIAINVPEQTTGVTTVQATDPDVPAQTLTFSIGGGADGGQFVIDPQTGVLSFAAAPSYLHPTDAGHDNVYNVVVQVSDGSLSASQAFTVNVSQVAAPAPAPAPAPVPIPPTELDPTTPPSTPAPAAGSAPAPSPAPATSPAPAPAAHSGTPSTPPASTLSTGHVTAPLGDFVAQPSALPPAPPPEVASVSAPVITFANTDSIAPALRAVVLDREGVQLISLQATDLTLAKLQFSVAGGGQVAEELHRALHSSAFSEGLDRLREHAKQSLNFEQSMTISVAGVSLGLSLVYVLWLIRGGVLMGSYLSALPAWRVLDPLPVLARPDEETEEDDEDLGTPTDVARNTLRGFE